MAPLDSLPGIAIAEYLGTDFLTEPANADSFFERFTIGNDTRVINQPFERLSHYEELMHGLRLLDADKYERMHKGTPFFFMAWLSFDLRNYEKALFYLDTAISEDVRNAPDWRNLPGAAFLKLDSSCIAARTVADLRNVIRVQMSRFNGVSGNPPLTLGNWTQRFVEPLMATPQLRTILCSLYVFFYEFRDRLRELEFRAGVGHEGSNHPFLSHLFLGGLIFESLLKQFYQGTTLGPLFDALKADFGIPPATAMPTTANVPNPFAAIHNGIAGHDVVTAFTTTGKLRNTTGHNLDRDNIFDQPSRYVDLFQQVVNAVFYVVSVKYLP
jgi:hypothetical protein